jgi:hypothetical protein
MLEERYEGMFSIYPSFVKNYLESDCHANNCLTFEKSADFILNLSKKYGIYTLSLFPKQNIIYNIFFSEQKKLLLLQQKK